MGSSWGVAPHGLETGATIAPDPGLGINTVRRRVGVAGSVGPHVERVRSGEIYGIPDSHVFDENNAIRCAGCGEPISGTPFRISLLDIVAPESPPSWAVGARLNPGPHQFHALPDHFRKWARRRGHLFCRPTCARSCARCRSRATHPAGACVTACIARRTSSSPPNLKKTNDPVRAPSWRSRAPRVRVRGRCSTSGSNDGRPSSSCGRRACSSLRSLRFRDLATQRLERGPLQDLVPHRRGVGGGLAGSGTCYLLGRTRFGYAVALSLFLAGLFTFLAARRMTEPAGLAPILYFIAAGHSAAVAIETYFQNERWPTIAAIAVVGAPLRASCGGHRDGSSARLRARSAHGHAGGGPLPASAAAASPLSPAHSSSWAPFSPPTSSCPETRPQLLARRRPVRRLVPCST